MSFHDNQATVGKLTGRPLPTKLDLGKQCRTLLGRSVNLNRDGPELTRASEVGSVAVVRRVAHMLFCDKNVSK
jgi:hypothetical protein